MKKSDVLAKFLKVNELIRNQRDIAENSNGRSQKIDKNIDNNNVKLNHSSKSMLCVLLNNDGINQRNLAGLLSISPQAVSESIKKLESFELIIKENGSQKNENIIFLTDLGKDKAKLLRRKISAHANKVFKDFSDEELSLFFDLLNKIS